MGAVPHLNELNEKFADKGLSIVAVTGEGKAKTEPWIEKVEANYPYAYDQSGDLARSLGVKGIPNAVLLDSAGRVVYQGSPSRITDEMVEQVLPGTFKTPVYEMSKELDSVKKPLLSHQFGKAVKAADRLEQGQELKEAILALVSGQVSALRASQEAGDFLTVTEEGKRLSKECSGLPEAKEVAAILKEVNSDRDAKRIIKGQKAVRKLQGEVPDLQREKDVRELIESVEKVQKAFEGTIAGKEAAQLKARLEAMLKR